MELISLKSQEPRPGDLLVDTVDYMIDENSKNHHTDKFYNTGHALSNLIIRRGQTFQIRITFKTAFQKDKDKLEFAFMMKKVPSAEQSERKKIKVIVNNLNTSQQEGWLATIKSIDMEKVIVEITPSPDCCIGEYRPIIGTQSSARTGSYYKQWIPKWIIILFNSWEEKDSVYLKDASERDEYILNDQGVIWRGGHNQMKATPWNYFQFHESALNAVLYALSYLGDLPLADRADPIKVSRHLAAIVNSNDDNGILEGKWEGSYADGTEPWIWQGSKAILEKFMTDKIPVKYGQCWVFAGLVCTLSRCLGIPCRVVTNFQSAHDTHESLTIDKFYDSKGEPVERLNEDSVWNFHVWDEVWFKRPDLSSEGKYDGWNVIDATPQEESDGLHRLGPTSVKAIRLGEVGKPYDGSFVFAEVNADEVDWHFTDKEEMNLLRHWSDSIGLSISTKAVGSDQRDDITADYKAGEKTVSERKIVAKALKIAKSHISEKYLKQNIHLNSSTNFEDLSFKLVPMKDQYVGSSFEVFVDIMNHSDEIYNVELKLFVRSKTYNAPASNLVKEELFEKTIKPKKKTRVGTKVKYGDYEGGLPSLSLFEISVIGKVIEPDHEFSLNGEFRLHMPRIKIEKIGRLVVGQPFTCRLTLKNPLPKPMTEGYFMIEGPDASSAQTIHVDGQIDKYKKKTIKVTLTPQVAGTKMITAKFWCRELNDINGFLNGTVRDVSTVSTNHERFMPPLFDIFRARFSKNHRLGRN